MRTWSLGRGDPLALRIAADVRLGPTDYPDDQTWELSLDGGDPPALALRTSYGLRARDVRVFPGFQTDNGLVVDPDGFAAAPVVELFFVNYLRVRFAPVAGVQARAEYWVPDSHAVAGQFTFANTGGESRSLSVQIASQLRPLDGKVMLPGKERRVLYLQGSTGPLQPVFLVEGGQHSELSAWTALARPLHLVPGEMQIVRWVQAARPQAADSLALAQELLEQDWPAALQQLFDVNAAMPEIETGEPDWDAAFAFGLKASLASYVGPTAHLPHPTFVFTRLPERGYSRAGDGSDYDWQWDGQVATEAYVNLPQVAMAAPELAKGVIRNYLAVQAPDGFIDWKPGLAGQRNRALCLPLLATCTWRVYEYTEDLDFVAEVFAGLLRFLRVWFSDRCDRDADGLPEWQHTIQSAFDDCPSFGRHRRWAQGADVTYAESPDLASYVYRECVALAHMARLLEKPDAAREVADHAARLRERVNAMWSAATNSYHYVDRDSHLSPSGVELGRGRGELSLEPYQTFALPQRGLVRILGPHDARPAARVAFHGVGTGGRRMVETLKGGDFQWYWGSGSATTARLYREIKRVEVLGIDETCETIVSTVDYQRQDQTLLLPIWAGIPQGSRLAALVKTITDPARYWRPYGIPNCAATDPAYAPDNREGSGGVWMMWNTMIGEGLADSGYRAEAAELIGRIMTVILHTLKSERCFREAYNADEPAGLGDRDYVWGVAPLHLFLHTVGVRVISPHKVWLAGANPFPHPVTVRHHGVIVTKQGATALVRFPTGKDVRVEDPEEQFVEDEGYEPQVGSIEA